MKRLKKGSLLLASILLVATSIGCSKIDVEQQKTDQTNIESSESKEVKPTTYKDTLVYAMWSSPDGFFNPTLSNTMYDGAVNELIYDSMIKYDQNMNIVPAMASSYEVSEDEKTISFELRNDVIWHDGIAVTPEDVVFTLESLAKAEYTGSYGNIAESIEGYGAYHAGDTDHISGITVDGQKISVQLKEVYAPALVNIGTFGIIPKHIWSETAVGDWQTASDLLAAPIGCGPYEFSEYENGHHLKLVANEAYYNGPVATKNFIFKIANRDNVQIELKNGEVDIADVSDLKAEDVDALETTGLEMTSFPNNLIQYMGFNLRDKRFQDGRVRAAFMHAIDRQLMVDILLGGKGQLINTPMIPTNWAYPPVELLNPYAYDVEQAKALLKEAGWEDRNNNGILEDEAGNDFTVILTYPSGDKFREETAIIIQNYLKAVGINLELEMLEFRAVMTKVVGNHEFDLYLMGNNPDADPDPKPYWHSSAATDKKGVYGWNISAFKNEEADKLMEAGLATSDQDSRKEIYNAFGVLMNKELPWVTLYSKDIIMAYTPNLENYHPSTYTKFVNVENWMIRN